MGQAAEKSTEVYIPYFSWTLLIYEQKKQEKINKINRL